jgi:hypothetical protein
VWGRGPWGRQGGSASPAPSSHRFLPQAAFPSFFRGLFFISFSWTDVCRVGLNLGPVKHPCAVSIYKPVFCALLLSFKMHCLLFFKSTFSNSCKIYEKSLK